MKIGFYVKYLYLLRVTKGMYLNTIGMICILQYEAFLHYKLKLN